MLRCFCKRKSSIANKSPEEIITVIEKLGKWEGGEEGSTKVQCKVKVTVYKLHKWYKHSSLGNG